METLTPVPGGLSTLAWASLATHAAGRPGDTRSVRDSWPSDSSKHEEEEEQEGRDFTPPQLPERMSDVPSVCILASLAREGACSCSPDSESTLLSIIRSNRHPDLSSFS